MNTKIRTTIVSLVAASSLAMAAIAPAVSHAEAKSPAKAVTCPGGYAPGTKADITQTVAGGPTKIKHYICGSDGAWHQVVSLEGSQESTRPPVGKAIATPAPVTTNPAPITTTIRPVAATLG
jgi:hypothetical protein